MKVKISRIVLEILPSALDGEEGREIGREVLDGRFEDFQPIDFCGGL